MAGHTEERQVFGKTECKASLKEDAHAIRLDLLQPLIFVRYSDHVLYNRASALFMQPQIREAVGWLVYEAEQYIILSWDRDAAPPTLHGGDPKASGLVLLRSDIVEFRRLAEFLPQELGVEKCLNCNRPLKKNRVCASRQRSEKLESEGEKKNE